MLLRLLSFLPAIAPIAPYLLGGILLVGAVAGVRKFVKEAHYKNTIAKEKMNFNDCIMQSKTYEEIEGCRHKLMFLKENLK